MKIRNYSILSICLLIISMFVIQACKDGVSWELSPECEGTDDDKGCVTVIAQWDTFADSIAENATGDLIGKLTINLIDTATLTSAYTISIDNADISTESAEVDHVFKNVKPGPYYIEALLDDDNGGAKDLGDLYYLSLEELFESSRVEDIEAGTHHTIRADMDLLD